MIPSYFKIEILAIQGEFVLSGHKGLTSVGARTTGNTCTNSSILCLQLLSLTEHWALRGPLAYNTYLSFLIYLILFIYIYYLFFYLHCV